MKKFVNHIDHVTWISHPETIEANVAELEKLTGAKLARFERKDMGFVMYISWEAGLEVVTPMAEPTEFNQALKDRLATCGEGVMGVVFGVKDLERHKARLEALGFQVGPEMDDHPDSPWHAQLILRERMAGVVMNSWFVLGDIDYADEVIPFGDADAPELAKLA
jgi:hypothetical protein